MSRWQKLKPIWLLMAFAVLLLIYSPVKQWPAAPVTAQVTPPPPAELTGWAWSSNIGWISFNCADAGNCASPAPFSDYKVTLDASTGNLGGYAWSNNIGWIKFNPSGSYPGVPNYSARWSQADNTVTGWVRTCAVFVSGCAGGLKSSGERGGWDGWIKLAKDPGDSGGGYGVTTTLETVGNNVNLRFTGFAWGSDVLGWIKFDPTAPSGNSDVICTNCGGGNFNTLTVDVMGSGRVDSDDGFIVNCTTNCSHNYPDNQIVTVDLTASAGTFIGWSGDACYGSTDQICQVTMNADRTVTAQFSGGGPTLTLEKQDTSGMTISSGLVSTGDGGIACGAGCSSAAAGYSDGSTVEISAQDDGGATFVRWEGDSGCDGGQTHDITMTSSDKICVAVFNAPPPSNCPSGLEISGGVFNRITRVIEPAAYPATSQPQLIITPQGSFTGTVSLSIGGSEWSRLQGLASEVGEQVTEHFDNNNISAGGSVNLDFRVNGRGEPDESLPSPFNGTYRPTITGTTVGCSTVTAEATFQFQDTGEISQ